ncbi:alpha-(1,3)-fucosyltransferase C-like isoform X2 [Battus philenor]
MPLFTPLRFRFSSILIQTTSYKFFLSVVAIGIIISIFFIQILNKEDYSPISDSYVQEALENIAQDSRYAEVYRKKDRLPAGIKYILLWTQKDYEPFPRLGEGQRAFIKNNCPMSNCYVTDDKFFFGGNITKFDAIAFNGRNIDHLSQYGLPKNRTPHQKYIFFNMESSDNYPICNEIFNGYFNWTATYKLNSDIPFPYIQIRNRKGEVVGPKPDMKWDEKLVIHEDLTFIQNKSKAAAWFVSHCSSRSERKKLVKVLQKYLDPYGLSIDIYGGCGPLKCPRNAKKSCDDMLERDYFFYLSLENSFAEDYVTEKLLTALHHNTIPIVYGGADYSRFLPPNTYLDALKMRPSDLAATMSRLTLSPELFSQYFRWKSQYTYLDPSTSDSVCELCAALNNDTMMRRPTVYEDFRSWWNPNYRDRC